MAQLRDAFDAGKAAQRDDDDDRYKTYLERLEAAELAIYRAANAVGELPLQYARLLAPLIVEARWSLGEIPASLTGFVRRDPPYFRREKGTKNERGNHVDNSVENPELSTRDEAQLDLSTSYPHLSTSNPHDEADRIERWANELPSFPQLSTPLLRTTV